MVRYVGLKWENSGNWFDEKNRKKKRIHFIMIRCWPSRILHERHAPDNLLAQERTVGEFLVHFFGSKEFFWANKHHYLSFENRCMKWNDARDSCHVEQSFKDGKMNTNIINYFIY
jgi:hypothetical protein